MSEPASEAPPPRVRIKFVVWMAFGAVFFASFIWLGTWQVQRYHLKLHISHAMTARVHAAPVPAPGRADWPRIASGHLQYLHVRLQGRYIPSAQTLVRGTSEDGYGYWVMTPLRTARGFTVLVNRGYIPPGLPQTPAFAKTAAPTGDISITGLLRLSEPGGGFLRRNQPQANQWYSRDVAAIAAARDLPAGQVAPYFVDAAATPTHARWPAAGLTKVSIYNHSLGYAITWYLLALGTLLAAGIVIRNEYPPHR